MSTDLDRTNNVHVLDEAPYDDEATKASIGQYNRRLAFAALVDSTYDEAKRLLLAKHKAYGPKNISSAPGGALNGLRVRMHDKLARLNNLLDNPSDLGDEALRDTMLDLMNYAAIAVMVLDEGWPEA